MTDIEINYWNYGRGKKKDQKRWTSFAEFRLWFNKQPDRIKGRFSVKLNGGYAKDSKSGVTAVVDYTGPKSKFEAWLIDVMKNHTGDDK